ncbi:signal transduction histidine kinase [Breznakibacter xylanolyticus]|uniref:histidine kinase n=1 Tax=Breznakibacter xylanolyticus TaxID=990 RepID=A0A2W7NE53_9BACT|nr:signal transduction histidine kinase [Breznakibacter xylanolyticus]
MRLLHLAISLILMSSGVWSQTTHYKFRRLDTSRGLSNNQIQNVFVDSRGFAWFSSVSGLNRFDGYNVKVFRHNPDDSLSIPYHSVTRIYEDYKGYLWTFSFNNELAIYNPHRETFGLDDEVFRQAEPVSKNYISELLLDGDSMQWISNLQFGVYRYNPRNGKVDHLVHREGDASTLRTDRIVHMALDSKGFLWTLNRDALLEKIDRRTLKVVDRIQLVIPVTSEEEQWYQMFIDSDDDFWVYSDNNALGLFHYSLQERKQYAFHLQSVTGRLSSNFIAGVVQDKHGMIWVGTDHGGINLMNKRDFSVRVLRNEPGDPYSLSQNSVKNLFQDRTGAIWVGTYKNGVCYYHPGLFQFGLFQYNPFKPAGLPSNDIDCFAEDPAGNLWIGTNGNGLIYHDRQSGTYRTFRHNPSDPQGLSNDVIVCMSADHQGRLWAGTYLGGVNMYDGKRFNVFRHDPSDPRTIADDRIWQIIEDSQKRMWFGTLGGGLDMYDVRENRFLHYRSGDLNSISSDFVLALAEEPGGKLWVGTSSGLDVLDFKGGRFNHFANDVDRPGTLSNNLVLSVLCDKRGWIWVGTRSGLNCYDKESGNFRVLRTDDGLPDNSIISLQEDDQGNIWMSTLNGLACVRMVNATSPLTFEYVIKTYDLMDGLQGMEFNEHASYKTHRGELLFGGVNGFNLFVPSHIVDVDDPTSVILTDFKLQNRSVRVGEAVDGRVVLTSAIGSMSEIHLKHFQNVFSFEFSALNHLYPDKVTYRYQLEGFNEHWIMTDAHNRIATYTNLNPGEYVLRVAAAGNDGRWGEAFELRILIIPPFYATKVAFVIYFLLLLGMIVLWATIIRRREHLKYLRKQERVEHQRMHELDAMKIRFFTNVSHEFRTPLTLILTPLDKLMQLAPTEEMRVQLQMIQRNGKRLLNLVNQLLDFRKMEVQSIALNPSYGNIVRFMKDTADSFNDLSESKNISYQFRSNVDSFFMWFDHDKMEKVLFNLMSNAFKFTPSGGAITVSLNVIAGDGRGVAVVGADCVELRVSDTGIGIAPDKLERVFDRFFQNEGNGALTNQGSGIGLALTQEFVRLHKGVVSVESEVDLGSSFIVQIPVVGDATHKPVDVDGVVTVDNKQVDALPGQVSDNAGNAENEDKPLVLIVEDNEDLRFYLKENLRMQYRIVEAADGMDGWQKVQALQPTLVVTDVMMPVMDGLELSRKMKQDAQTSHIPVIILTARNTHEQKIEGLETGADDYLTKPFSYEILELKIKKLIASRQELHKTLNLQYEIKPGEIGITSMDEKFIQRALDLVEKNISNTDFSVEKMSREMGVSRGHLYNKTMALTGKTPIEFIRIMRLKRAAQLLAKSQMTVAEIAYEVGFNDPKYFSKYFKDEFGMSPSEYAKKMMGKGAAETNNDV